MRSRLLDYLACPECHSADLALEAFSVEDDEIMAGVLTCEECHRRYPIIGGVPRLLPDALIGTLPQYHPDFFSRYRMTPTIRPEQDAAVRTTMRTLSFYSFARAKLFVREPRPELLTYWRRSLQLRIPEVQDLNGQFGLDAGCGEGRYTYCLAESGAEMIGMDLSEAVNPAYLRNRGNPHAHIVQGSIYQPPFRRGIFDFVLSTGVLHHLPDPQAGFQALVPTLKAGGSMRIWVYGLRQMSLIYRLSHLTFLRSLGSRLSPEVSYRVSVPLALLLHLLVFRPVRFLEQVSGLRARIPVQLRELASLPLHMHIAEVQDRIGVPVTHFVTQDEAREWYKSAGLERIAITPTQGGRGWSARGYVPAEQPAYSHP